MQSCVSRCPLSDGRDWWLGCWNGLGERQLVCIELVLCVQKMSLMVLIDKLSVADVGDGVHGNFLGIITYL